MLWIASDQDWQPSDRPLSLTIGNFDGVHLGHRKLLEVSRDWAQKHGGKSWLLTFDPHPMQLFNPAGWGGRLFPLMDQYSTLRSLGLDGVFVQPFSRPFSELSVEQFLQDFLWKKFQPAHVVVGYDFAFGRRRSGTAQMLKDFLLQRGREFDQVPAFQLGEQVVSSSFIRQALQSGQVREANRFLGRPFSYRGRVVKGDQRGRGLGFPTANLSAPSLFVPLLGVYASRIRFLNVKGEAGTDQYNAVTNIGVNPTFSGGEGAPIRVETHIFDFSREIYGELIEVELHEFLRPERKFAGINELVAQIQLDAGQARELLGSR